MYLLLQPVFPSDFCILNAEMMFLPSIFQGYQYPALHDAKERECDSEWKAHIRGMQDVRMYNRRLVGRSRDTSNGSHELYIRFNALSIRERRIQRPTRLPSVKARRYCDRTHRLDASRRHSSSQHDPTRDRFVNK